MFGKYDTQIAADPTPSAPEAGSALLGPKWRMALAALAITAVPVVLALGTWASYWAEHRNDQYQLILLGQSVYQGGSMYADAWENKPPGIAWISAAALWLGRGSPLGPWIVPGAFALVAAVVIGWSMSRLLSPRAGRRTALLTAVIFSIRLYDAPSINPDFYAAVLGLIAGSLWLVALFAASPGPRFIFGAASGLIWIAASAFKQTGMLGLGVVSIAGIIGMVGSRERRGLWRATTASVWVGSFVGLACIFSVLLLAGTLGAAWEAVVTFNRGLLSWGHVAESLAAWERTLQGLRPVQLAIWLGLLGLVTAIWSDPARQKAGGPVYVLLAWWAVEVCFALLGPSQSMRYWQGSFPPMLLLAAIGLFQLEASFARLPKGHRAPLALAVVTALLMLARPMFHAYRLGIAESYNAYSSRTTERGRYERLGERLRGIVPEGERIYVLAYDAGVYVHARRLPASRFTYPQSPLQMEEILTDIEAGKAYALLMPQSPAPAFERWCDEACQVRIQRVAEQYDVSMQVDRYRVRSRDIGTESQPGAQPPRADEPQGA